MATAAARRPGIRFESRTPPPGPTLPRTDIAAFVGFAASGPLHVPVVVEDVARFQELFGEDLLLARDRSAGRGQYAELAPAVRAFFRNGGRRCWVVRVADAQRAHTNAFPLPGLLAATGGAAAAGGGDLGAATALARSPGAWS
ncbi:MAG TPA: hypothetical protein VJ957_11815, partial [Longimicrobiales bacterium]|nr:hypothetical protein [Longimicrobiales bacterium]